MVSQWPFRWSLPMTCGLALNICSRRDSRWWWGGPVGHIQPCGQSFLSQVHTVCSPNRTLLKGLRKYSSSILKTSGHCHLFDVNRVKSCWLQESWRRNVTKYGTGGILVFQSTGESWKLSNITVVILGNGLIWNWLIWCFLKKKTTVRRKGRKGFSIL